ncbi:MAG: glutathione S-transferase family protein [Alphaproteobacteria bacterium]
MLKLFYAPGSCALASHIALEEAVAAGAAGAAYEAVRLDLSAGDQRRSDYLAINAKGRVPALVADRGILTETPAILAWVAQSFPAARLAPQDDPHAFAVMQAFNSYLCSTVHVAHAHGARGTRWADDPVAIADMKRKVPETMAACFELIETEMLAGPWVMGAAYSVADPYLYTVTRWLERDGVDPARFPRVADHRARMEARPAVAKVLAVQYPS